MRKGISILLVMFVAIFSRIGCTDDELTKADNKKMKSVKSLMTKQPATDLSFSMDRYLLNERNVRLNSPNKMSYLYVVMIDGTWLKCTIIGKLASTSKRLTNTQGIVHWDSNLNSSIGPVPDEMGTYGESTGSKVGLSTLGSLLEFGGMNSFIYSETPLNFTNFAKPIAELNVEITDAERKELQEKLNNLKKQAGG